MVVRNALALLLLAAPVAAQGSGTALTLQEAIDFERRGRHEEAAARYRTVLGSEPTNAAALLGLERSLEALRRLDAVLPFVRAALAADSGNRTVRSLEVRVWGALEESDSVRAAATRWIAVEPGSPEPYREWAGAASRRGDLTEAKRVLAEGTRRVGDASLAQDLAQVTTLAGDWIEAAQQWMVVVRASAGLVPAASASLGRAPPATRDLIVGALTGRAADPASRLLASDLLAGWGRADEAWPLLDAVLPSDRGQAVSQLSRFVDRARSARTREGTLVRAYALERLIALSTGQAADRFRLQAAQAYAEAGDLTAAEQLLRALSPAGSASGAVVGEAMTSLIAAMAEEGLVKQAEERLRQWEDRLSGDAQRQLVETLGWAWMAKGDLDRAEALVRNDSTIESAALRGWIALYRGEIAVARERFREAGPYAGTRAAATQRTEILAILERLQEARIPDLGRALHLLAQQDTIAAIQGLERVASRLPLTAGRQDVLALAGQVASARHDLPAAERLLVAAISADSAGPASAVAELLLARVHRDQGRLDIAAVGLEHLILSHPESAEVPHARRMLDELRGVVP